MPYQLQIAQWTPLRKTQLVICKMTLDLHKKTRLTGALEDWVEVADDGLGAIPVFKTPDVAVADIVVVSTSSTEVVKLTVSSTELLVVHVTVAEG